MSRPTNASIFIRNLRECGGRAGNPALRSRLNWDEKKYWSVHQELVEAGLIAKGRGQGGTVILVVPDSIEGAQHAAGTLSKSDASAVSEELVQAVEVTSRTETRELDLYEPALEQLRKHWPTDKQLLYAVFEITALQGRRDTGGSWSRPDIVGVGLRKFEYLPDRVVEVYSFEIKAEYDVSIKGVLEALAHREAATRSYVIYHTGGKAWDDFAEAQRIEQLAARHGVGVIVAADISSFSEGWDERVSASRSASDPEALDRFIRLTLTEETRGEIRRSM